MRRRLFASSSARSKLQIPHFADEIIATPALVRLLLHELESRFFVEVARRAELTLGPERDPAISGLTREANAFFDQSTADTESARARFDEEQTQFRDRRRLLHQHHRTDDLAVLFRHPAAFAFRIEVLQKLSRNLRDESFEF